MYWAEICSAGAVHADGEACADLQDGVRGGGGGGGQHQAGLPPGQEDQDQVHKAAMRRMTHKIFILISKSQIESF